MLSVLYQFDKEEVKPMDDDDSSFDDSGDSNPGSDDNARPTAGHNSAPNEWEVFCKAVDHLQKLGRKTDIATLDTVRAMVRICRLSINRPKEAYARLPQAIRNKFEASQRKIEPDDLLKLKWEAEARGKGEAQLKSRIKNSAEYLLTKSFSDDSQFEIFIAQFTTMDQLFNARMKEPKDEPHRRTEAADKRRKAAIDALARNVIGNCPIPHGVKDPPAEGEVRIMLTTRGADSKGELGVMQLIETGGETAEQVRKATVALINIAIKQKGITISNAK